MATLEEATAAKATLRSNLGRPEWLRGVGIGKDDTGYCIKVNVASITADVEASIPREIDGVPVHVEVVGDISVQR